MPKQLVTIKNASEWASRFLKKEISEPNISYLIQYGKIKKHKNNGTILINVDDLKRYYHSFHGRRELRWKKKLGGDLNWALSFDHLREKDTTKHVHRLHPYKGKFIPQLVEYFIDAHINEFKKAFFFKKGDIILDPFSGSGTTLVQANELDIHSIGLDVSYFNCQIAESKLFKYDMASLENEIKKIKKEVIAFETANNIILFENELYQEMWDFNNKYFPSPEFKYKLNKNNINEDQYADEKESEFLTTYNRLVRKYDIKLTQGASLSFLDRWYIDNVRKEIDFTSNLIKQIKDDRNKKILEVILSRTIRSCRATTHSDLATLKEPQLTSYYCYKHKKICKPIFSIKKMFSRYATDTVERLKIFDKLRSCAYYALIPSDSRTVNIFSEIKKVDPQFYDLLKKQKIRGIFTSPPYVGQIDYHEQHAYAYDLLGFKREDTLEIGPLKNGQGQEARDSYVKEISAVFINCKKYLADNFDIFIVANDKYDLYGKIADKAGLKIVRKFKRPVLNRTERDKSPYSEIIFHMKNKS